MAHTSSSAPLLSSAHLMRLVLGGGSDRAVSFMLLTLCLLSPPPLLLLPLLLLPPLALFLLPLSTGDSMEDDVGVLGPLPPPPCCRLLSEWDGWRECMKPGLRKDRDCCWKAGKGEEAMPG